MSDDAPGQRDSNAPSTLINPLRRPRPWTWALSVLLFIAGLVLLLLPVSVVYYLDGHGNPYQIDTIYGTRSDEELGLPAGMFGPGQPPTDVTSIRLDCGTAFGPGAGEEPAGPEACSIAEQPRTVAGWLLTGLGVVGFAGGFVLPSVRVPARNGPLPGGNQPNARRSASGPASEAEGGQ